MLSYCLKCRKKIQKVKMLEFQKQKLKERSFSQNV